MMYSIKPIITHNDVISLPKCMYSVKNIHESGSGIKYVEELISQNVYLDVADKVNRILKLPTREMAELEIRQEKLLEQLEKLNDQIKNLKHQLKTNTHIKDKLVCTLKKINFPDDMVVKVNPSQPPFSLILLKTILKARCTLNLIFHLHSSVPKLSEKAVQFEKSFKNFDDTNLPSVNIRLIWKDSDDETTLSISPTANIRGEFNILRYLANSVSNALTYKNDLKHAVSVNAMVDVCYLLQNQSVSGKNKQILAKKITGKLSTGEWLVDSNISVADLALYSVVQNENLPILKNAIVQKWIQRCSNYCTN